MPKIIENNVPKKNFFVKHLKAGPVSINLSGACGGRRLLLEKRINVSFVTQNVPLTISIDKTKESQLDL